MSLKEAKQEQERLFPRRLMRVYKDMDTPTNEWVQIPPTLPEICLDLRSSVNGSSDPWTTAFLTAVVEMLKARRKHWDFTIVHSMDSAVLSMVDLAIICGEWELKQRVEDKTSW